MKHSKECLILLLKANIWGGGGGANIGIKANCGKSARRNIELTLLKVHFII